MDLSALDLNTALLVTAAGWVGSAIVQSIPSPDAENGKWYKFFYKFSHNYL